MKTKSIFLVFLTSFFLFSCVNSPNKSSNYMFEITGTFGTTTSALGNTFSNVVHYTDPDGNNHEWIDVSKGWSYSWTQTGERNFSIFVTNTSGSGDVIINLYKDNELIDSNTGFNGAGASLIY